MNFLAHLMLSAPTPEAWLGSVLPDLLHSRVPPNLPPTVRAWATMHLKIDGFADHHPTFQRSCERISGGFARYAGVLIDVFYDHFLARHWAAYHPLPLETFAARVYGGWREVLSLVPGPVAERLASMETEDWLPRYRDLEGVTDALTRLAARSRHAAPLQNALAELTSNDQPLAADFAAFFPELVAFVAQERPAAPLPPA